MSEMNGLELPDEVLTSGDDEFIALCFAARARFEIDAALRHFLNDRGVTLPATFPMAARWSIAATLCDSPAVLERHRRLVRRVEMRWNLLADQCHLSDRLDVPSLDELRSIYDGSPHAEAFGRGPGSGAET